MDTPTAMDSSLSRQRTAGEGGQDGILVMLHYLSHTYGVAMIVRCMDQLQIQTRHPWITCSTITNIDGTSGGLLPRCSSPHSTGTGARVVKEGLATCCVCLTQGVVASGLTLKSTSLSPPCECLLGVWCKQTLVVFHWETVVSSKLSCSWPHEHALFGLLHDTAGNRQGSGETAQGGGEGGREGGLRLFKEVRIWTGGRRMLGIESV